MALDLIAKRVDAQLNKEEILKEPKQVNVVIKKDFPLSSNKTSHRLKTQIKTNKIC